MVLKLVAYGPVNYVKNFFNCFDGILVCISLAGIIVPEAGSFVVFRSFRLFRLFALAKSFKIFRALLIKIRKTLLEVTSTALLLFLSMFVFSIGGRALFKGHLDFPGEEKPRHHFDTTYWSFITTFQVITGENWPAVIFDVMRGRGEIVGAGFCILNIVVNTWCMLSLFLAVIIDKFCRGDGEEDVDEELDEAMGTADDAD